MDKLVYTAATGMKAHMAAQAAIANNLANATTTGFRADRIVFERLELKGGGARLQARAPASEELTDFDRTPGARISTGRNLDVAVQGAPAASASAVFEAYWNNPLARPVRRLSLRPGERSLARLRRRLERVAASAGAQPCLERALATNHRRARTLSIDDDAIRIVSDPPEKARGLAGSEVAPVIEAMLNGARREALLVSPYFVPGETGVARLVAMARAGVRVSVITNSLAATDVVAVHAGYARYRRRLLEAGIELFEVKQSGPKRAGVFGSGSASLHTKAMVVDDGPCFVGSFNLDQRSRNLNTEMGVLVRHAPMARLMRRQHRWLSDGTRSWRVRLEGGRLCWEDGETTHRGAEPGASLLRRVLAGVTALLPIESQL